jgi:phosphatidate cytidylyltransferase
MSNLNKRVISAIFILICLIADYWFWGTKGVMVLGAFMCILGTWEYSRIAFQNYAPNKTFRFWFLLNCIILILVSLYFTSQAFIYWGIILATYLSVALWLFRNKIENDIILKLLSLSLLGFLYCALLPIPALLLFQLPNGQYWFLFLLSVVFFGDIFAYFGGRWFGNKKIMPLLSPNKTVAGAISGIIGSIIVGVLAGPWLGDIPILTMVIVCAFAAFLAQNGDFFESLIKRVANVKDSGRFMPGHGGVLDRLDGIFFAAPLIYAFASHFSK